MFLFFLSAIGLRAQEVVLHPTDVTTIKGNWARVSTSGAASGVAMTSTDKGWSSTSQPQASPVDYFEASFTAQAYTPYRIWLRVRAAADSKWNDSVWVQFGDSLDTSGSAAYRIGTVSGVLVNLEDCKGCSLSAWGWMGGSYWLGMNQQVEFPSAGTKTIRIQTREDGAQIDQIVLSPAKYLSSSPGQLTNDAHILARIGGASASASTTAKAVPGTIEAEDFDNGTNGAVYFDRTTGNNGGQYRSTDVDIESSSDGGYDVGWIDAGEWLDYTVNVSAAGNYTMEFRVASPNGSALRAKFAGVDETGSVSVPATGGWQTWTTVTKTVSLAAGTQTMQVLFDGGLNINRMRLYTASTTTSPESGSGPKGGTAWALPGTVQAEDFDLGGAGVGYADNTTGNAGGKYRTVDADIESTSDSGAGYDIGWTSAGEWLKYTVNVTTAGSYTLTARVASSGSGGTFHVEFNGTNKTGTLSVPNTGGWQTFRDVTATVSLSAGVQTMRVAFDGNGSTGAVGNVNYVRVATASTPTPTPTGTGKIRIMTWNIHFGKNASNVLNLDGQAQVMATSGADVILLQEASTWDGDQPNAFPTLLQQKTGKTWYGYWVAGNATTNTGQGVLLLSKFPIVASSKYNMEGTGFGRISVDVNGVRMNILTAHLEYYDTAKRTRQLNSLMSWARQFGGPRIMGGDFNSWWGESWIKTVETEYSDTWQDYTGSDQNGYTTGNIRFDYLFRAFDQNYRLSPTNCWVVSTSLSDHRPVVADYAIK